MKIDLGRIWLQWRTGSAQGKNPRLSTQIVRKASGISRVLEVKPD